MSHASGEHGGEQTAMPVHALPRPIDAARAAFLRDVMSAAEAGPLDWIDVNRLAALRLHPTAGDSSRYGHTLVLELAAAGVLVAEVTHTSDGAQMAGRVRLPAGTPRPLHNLAA
jgi:hypothetical protein